jgi:hypothetical protein
LLAASGSAPVEATVSRPQSQSLDAGSLLWSVLRERFLALFRKRPG